MSSYSDCLYYFFSHGQPLLKWSATLAIDAARKTSLCSGIQNGDKNSMMTPEETVEMWYNQITRFFPGKILPPTIFSQYQTK
jgi:hypothetical protein